MKVLGLVIAVYISVVVLSEKNLPVVRRSLYDFWTRKDVFHGYLTNA